MRQQLSLFTLSGQPAGPLTGDRSAAARRLMIGAAVVVVFLMTGACTSLILDDGHLPYGIALLLGLAQTTPVLLALTRPVAAWYAALAAMVVIALVATPNLGYPWPWTMPGLVAYLAVLLMLARSTGPLVSVVVWGITALTGGLLTLSGTSHPHSFDPLSAVLCAGALGSGEVLRGRGEARRRLKHQEHLTEAERSRNALLQERARIARELHDVVAHHMSVIAVQAEAAPYRVQQVPRELSESFATIRDNALTALNELRHLLGMLRSEEAGSPGTPDRAPQPSMADIEQLVANVRAAGTTVRMTVAGTPRDLPPGVGLSVFRILQEALSNALRHAPGCPIGVEIAYTDDEVRVRVVNGLPVEAASSRPAAALKEAGSGHGVLGMRERAAMLGGTLRAGTVAGPAAEPDGQFEVLALIPVGESANA